MTQLLTPALHSVVLPASSAFETKVTGQYRGNQTTVEKKTFSLLF